MKLIYYRKPTVYLFYLAIFLLIEYLFFKLFFDTHQCTVKDNDNSDNDLIVSLKNRIIDLRIEVESLKKSQENCLNNNNRLDKLAKFINTNEIVEQCDGDKVGDTFIRDFYRYECKNIVRYGSRGINENAMKRFDGAYYVCEDGNLKPVDSNCIVLSFGIYNNDMFDEAINKKLNCLVHSMDPFNEPDRVSQIRQQKSEFRNSVMVEINEKWKFHSLGITNGERIRNVSQMGWLDTYEHILDYLKLNNKIIDVFKIDTEGAEWESIPYIMSTKPELLCKYVKQMAIETHSWLYTHESNYKVIKSLEVCFRMYKRDQRFYFSNGDETEWDLGNFQLPLNKFKNEVDLARFLFLYGELYFINKNFL